MIKVFCVLKLALNGKSNYFLNALILLRTIHPCLNLFFYHVIFNQNIIFSGETKNFSLVTYTGLLQTFSQLRLPLSCY